MKRTIALIVSSVALLTSSLNVAAQKTIPSTRLNIIPAWITPDGKASVYSYSEFATENDLFTIYDDEFNVVKSFRAPNPDKITYTYYTQEREWVEIVELRYCNPTGSIIEIDGKKTGLSIDQVLKYAKETIYEGCEISSLPDGTPVIAQIFWRDDEYGKKYPQRFYMLTDFDAWGLYEAQYDTSYRQLGEWGEPEEHTETRSAELLYIELVQPDGSSGRNDYVLTRGIFSDDYCLIYHSYKTVTYSQENETSKAWGSKLKSTGYKIYDSEGNLVSSIQLPQGLYSIAASRDDLRYMDINGKRYVICPVINDDNEYYYVVYRLDDRSNLTMVATTPASKIAPRAPRRGENVTVTLNEKVAAAGCVIRVVSTNGQTVMQENVPAGQSTFDINTSRFPQGIYVVSVSSSEANTDVAKIVIR